MTAAPGTITVTSLDPLPAARPARPRPRSRPRPAALYDAAATAEENKNHWAQADGLSPNAANQPDVRHRLRNRSRYECDNNGYALGLVRGRATATVGVCPRLQLSLPEAVPDPDFDRLLAVPAPAVREVELLWADWADRVALADKLRVMVAAEARDGESFGLLFTNPALPDVQLDLKVVEAEQCTTPDLGFGSPTEQDGVVFDAAGNPVEYHILRQHPGDLGWWSQGFGEYDRYPAARVVHLFDPDRPSQARGVPATRAALPLYAILRRYTLASLGSAELAAMIAGVIESENHPVGDEADFAPQIEAMDKIPFARNALLTLAGGQTAKAFKSEQPAPSYREFKNEVLAECGRGMDAPRNVSIGSSHEYNFSSGRLDHLPHHQAIHVRRDRLRRVVLDRLFRAWAAEAALLPGFLPAGLPPPGRWRWRWRWDGFGSIDPVKDATANEIALRSGQTTLEKVAAAGGDDWEDLLEQQARERRVRERLGLPDPAAPAAPAPPAEDPADA